MDELYPSQELEFLDKNESSAEPLICKMSDIIYRQYEKEKERIKHRKAANAYALIVSCLFITLMIALVVSQYLEDKFTTTYSNITLSSNYTSEGIITTTQRSFLDIFKRF